MNLSLFRPLVAVLLRDARGIAHAWYFKDSTAKTVHQRKLSYFLYRFNVYLFRFTRYHNWMDLFLDRPLHDCGIAAHLCRSLHHCAVHLCRHHCASHACRGHVYAAIIMCSTWFQVCSVCVCGMRMRTTFVLSVHTVISVTILCKTSLILHILDNIDDITCLQRVGNMPLSPS